MSELVEQFAELFEGSIRAYGTEEGGCLRVALSENYEDYLLRTEAHLRGGAPFGVYPMKSFIRDGWMVHWGCTDFDEGEERSWVHALNLYMTYKALDITSWIERSRSKGYHVWVFFEDWVDALTARKAQLAACQIAGVPMKEINPKQGELQDGQLGNYVRLPYPNAYNEPLCTPERRVVVDPDLGPIPLGTFVNKARWSRVELDKLEFAAGLYQEPVRKVPAKRNWDLLEGEAVDRLSGKTKIIFEEGPLEGGDRSDTLWKLAMYLYEDGRHTPEEALVLLTDADSRWGKFSTRPDGQQRLQELVDKAWS